VNSHCIEGKVLILLKKRGAFGRVMWVCYESEEDYSFFGTLEINLEFTFEIILRMVSVDVFLSTYLSAKSSVPTYV
jgi:hypothetical protein